MKSGIAPLLFAQFLTAFGDNAILFATVAMLMQGAITGDWYIPALQSSFFLILLNVSPLVAYLLVGVGAAVYSPAKYGILPEMVSHNDLVKANSWIEASTITAIILGTIAGGQLADRSISGAFWLVMAVYVISIIATLFIPKLPARGAKFDKVLPTFFHMISDFIVSPRARFSILGAAPLVLSIHTAGEISELTLFLAIGVIAGAALVPKLIPIERLRRARLAAYLMGGMILVLAIVDSVWPARFILLAIGIAGGLFVVPINAALQEIGHKTIGSGRAVAVQNFFENVAMLTTVGLYTLATTLNVSPVTTIVVLGIIVIIATVIVSWHLPPDPLKPSAINQHDLNRD
jgi:LPLT family lysophospholipid transporter-like MFS transporter